MASTGVIGRHRAVHLPARTTARAPRPRAASHRSAAAAPAPAAVVVPPAPVAPAPPAAPAQTGGNDTTTAVPANPPASTGTDPGGPDSGGSGTGSVDTDPATSD